MTVPFSVQIELRDHRLRIWQTARVDIFEGSDAAARKIGSYEATDLSGRLLRSLRSPPRQANGKPAV
jgi:hypothetical protein